MKSWIDVVKLGLTFLAPLQILFAFCIEMFVKLVSIYNNIAALVTNDSLEGTFVLFMASFSHHLYFLSTHVWAVNHSVFTFGLDVPEKVFVCKVKSPTVIRTLEFSRIKHSQYCFARLGNTEQTCVTILAVFLKRVVTAWFTN